MSSTETMLNGLQKEGQFATHLHAAVISQDLNALKQLNHKGADLSTKNSVGSFSLCHVAASVQPCRMIWAQLQSIITVLMLKCKCSTVLLLNANAEHVFDGGWCALCIVELSQHLTIVSTNSNHALPLTSKFNFCT